MNGDSHESPSHSRHCGLNRGNDAISVSWDTFEWILRNKALNVYILKPCLAQRDQLVCLCELCLHLLGRRNILKCLQSGIWSSWRVFDKLQSSSKQ
jgi:hypothetical protein